MRRELRLWGLWSVVVIAAVIAAQVVGFAPFALKGERAPAPEFAFDRLLDTDYYAQADAFLAEDLAIRGLGLRGRAAVEWEWLGDATGPAVIAGADRWLYLDDYVNLPCDHIREGAALAAPELGERFALLLSAPKSAIHPTPLPSHAQEDECVVDARASARDAVGDQLIEVSSALHAIEAAGDDAFLRDDSHWSPEGRLVVAEAIVNHWAPGTWRDDLVVDAEVERLGNLRRFIGIEVPSTMSGHAVDLSFEVLNDRRAVTLPEDLILSFHSRSAYPEAVPGVTHIVGDSQLAYVLPLIAPYFEELVFGNWLLAGLGVPDLTSFAGAPADRVLMQSIERGAPGRIDLPARSAVLAQLEG